MTESAVIKDPVMLIRMPRSFKPGMSESALYEATRGVWRIGPRRNGVRYALAIHAGVVHEVYEVVEWHPAWTTRYETRTRRAGTSAEGRWEFTGKKAPEDVRKRYRLRSVAQYFSRGAQNPITYVNGA